MGFVDTKNKIQIVLSSFKNLKSYTTYVYWKTYKLISHVNQNNLQMFCKDNEIIFILENELGCI